MTYKDKGSYDSLLPRMTVSMTCITVSMIYITVMLCIIHYMYQCHICMTHSKWDVSMYDSLKMRQVYIWLIRNGTCLCMIHSKWNESSVEWHRVTGCLIFIWYDSIIWPMYDSFEMGSVWERRRRSHWKWKLKSVPQKLRYPPKKHTHFEWVIHRHVTFCKVLHPPQKLRFQFLKIVAFTDLFSRKQYLCVYPVPIS